ncbi:MAG: hypothetical protein HC892_15780 [Saprospiraceae bacterium]|nr:hypothetical protein [Saprospiraceae bacterium]
MIEERIRSKQERLDDMKKTQDQVEKQREKQQERDQRRSEKERISEAKKEAEARIQEQMESVAASRDKDEAEKLAKAAASIAEEKQPKESLVGAVGQILSETLTDAADTMVAVAGVVGEKAMEFFESFTATDEPKADDEQIATEETTESTVAFAVEQEIEDATQILDEKVEQVSDDMESFADSVVETVEDAIPSETALEDTAENVVTAIEEGVEAIKEDKA